MHVPSSLRGGGRFCLAEGKISYWDGIGEVLHHKNPAKNRLRSAGVKTSRISLFLDEKHCSHSHKFLQIHASEQAHSFFLLGRGNGIVDVLRPSRGGRKSRGMIAMGLLG